MSTRGKLRATLRTVLGDATAGSYLWSDELLNRLITDAVQDYSLEFPRERSTTVTTVAEQREYALPADCLRVARVTLLEDADAAQVMVEGGDTAGHGFELYGGQLVLMPKPAGGGDLLEVRYLASHAELSSDETVSTVPASDEGLVMKLAAARAVESLLVDEAKRRQYESRSGQGAREAAGTFRHDWERGATTLRRRVRRRNLVAR